jgi:hypothetical protein
MRRHVLFGSSAGTVRIAQDKAAIIVGVRFKIENAAGEHVGSCVVKHRVRARGRATVATNTSVDLFAVDAQHRQGRAPFGLAIFAIEHGDRRIAVVIARHSFGGRRVT